MKQTKTFKVVVALLLVFTMMFSVVACGNDTTKTDTDNSTTENSDQNTDQGGEDASTEDSSNETTEPAADAKYTYNDVASGSPKKWNPHEWETNDDSYIMGFTQMGLVDAQLNAEKNSYEFVYEMATGAPTDVTAKYAGNEMYGVPADATEGYAFAWTLNPEARWEDGTSINADTYIYSYQQLLNPQMKNYRASTIYSGSFEVANAEAYYKQGQEIYSNIKSGDAYREVEDADMVFTMTKDCAFFGGTPKSYYSSGYADTFVTADGVDVYEKYSENDYYPLTEEAKAELLEVSAAFGDSNPEAYKEWAFTFDGVSDSMDWEKVGILKTDDYELTFVLAKPITDFNLHYSLTSNYLVKEDLYEANKQETGDIIKTSYGTAADNYASYGPYKLVDYQEDKEIVMTRNDQWYGYTDGKHDGQFMATDVVRQIVEAQATQLQLFLQGKIDRVGLVATDMDKYRTSDYILYTPQSYTTKLTFNSDLAALTKRQSDGINKSILASKDFRHGFSLAIDREEFAAQCTATHSAGFGLFNYNYIADPATGLSYRNSDEAKNVLTKLYDVEDEDQISGFDKTKAQELMLKAYAAELEAGRINDTDVVELEFLTYNSDEAYVKMINFIQDSLNASLEGTELEGRVVIKMTPDENYYDHAQEGKFEMIMSTWGGSAMDPYGIVECYCDPDTMFEYGFTPKLQELTFEVNGEEITRTYYDWYVELTNGEYAAADAATRLQVLAGIEYGILTEYCTTPIYYRTSTSLSSQKVNEGTDVFCQIIDFGGIRHRTFNYTDAEWEEYCKSQDYQLTY